MFARAGDVDPVGAVGDTRVDAGLGVELVAQLIEVDDFERSAPSNRPSVGLQLAEQEAEECRLAGAVRADEADAIAAGDRRAEVAHDLAVAVREAHSFRLDDEPPGPL